ncbi:MAG: hypothetical protein AD742_17790 [Methylibium sp. NZG]|nr:MAG: hypothetical protein AD742_17790 [Methylibium sp. NZG]
MTKRLILWSIALTLLAGGCAWSAWQWYQNRYPTWREEVQLSDGRVIVVEQKHEVYENYGTNQSWVTFALPEMGGERTWNSYLSPQRIDVVDGAVYVFGAPRGIRQFNFYRKPKHYMVAFRWTGKEFERIPFLDLPERVRKEENIFPCVPAESRTLVTLGLKHERWCPVRGDKWKFDRMINVSDYEALATFYADLENTKPATN